MPEKTRRHTTKISRPPATVAAITRRNIEELLCHEERERAAQPLAYRLVERLARFCGTLPFLWLNVVAFAGWIILNATVAKFDPYPYTLLLVGVSLEAIVLSILILISQNLTAVESERRHHLDLQINLLNEREVTALMRVVIKMAEEQGIDEADLKEIKALAQVTAPDRVLDQIVKAEAMHGNAR